jgi:hypothetical protein
MDIKDIKDSKDIKDGKDVLADALARALSAVERDMQHHASLANHDCMLRDRPGYLLAGDATLAECIKGVVRAASNAGVEVPPGLRHASAIVEFRAIESAGSGHETIERLAGGFAPAQEWTAADFEVVAVVSAVAVDQPAGAFVAELLRQIAGESAADTERLQLRPKLVAILDQKHDPRRTRPAVQVGVSAAKLMTDCVLRRGGTNAWTLIAAMLDSDADAATLMTLAFDYAARTGCQSTWLAGFGFKTGDDLPPPPTDWHSIAVVIASRLDADDFAAGDDV